MVEEGLQIKAQETDRCRNRYKVSHRLCLRGKLVKIARGVAACRKWDRGLIADGVLPLRFGVA